MVWHLVVGAGKPHHLVVDTAEVGVCILLHDLLIVCAEAVWSCLSATALVRRIQYNVQAPS